jgi:two-component system KDP operon response regulator KdpE
MAQNVMQGRTILVVDDEPRMRQFIRMNLEVEGARVLEAGDGTAAVSQVQAFLPDLVVLDVQMPEKDGFSTLRAIRGISEVPVIMLTVRADESDRIYGLDLGADDYLGKPFSPRELMSRIRAVLRRAQQAAVPEETTLRIDDHLSIDFQRRAVLVDGESVRLRPTEWRLLYHLVQNAGWIMPHDLLLSRVWGPEYQGSDHYVRLYINYLRKKIEPDPANPKYILTEHGTGYRFVDFRAGQPGT